MATVDKLDFYESLYHFKKMFPLFETELIEQVLRANDGMIDKTVESLLAMHAEHESQQQQNQARHTEASNVFAGCDLPPSYNEIMSAKVGKENGSSSTIITADTVKSQQVNSVNLPNTRQEEEEATMSIKDLYCSQYPTLLIGKLPKDFLRIKLTDEQVKKVKSQMKESRRSELTAILNNKKPEKYWEYTNIDSEKNTNNLEYNGYNYTNLNSSSNGTKSSKTSNLKFSKIVNLFNTKEKASKTIDEHFSSSETSTTNGANSSSSYGYDQPKDYFSSASSSNDTPSQHKQFLDDTRIQAASSNNSNTKSLGKESLYKTLKERLPKRPNIDELFSMGESAITSELQRFYMMPYTPLDAKASKNSSEKLANEEQQQSSSSASQVVHPDLLVFQNDYSYEEEKNFTQK